MMKRLLSIFLTIGFVLASGALAQPELDTTFNSSGKMVFSRLFAWTRDMIVQPDDKVVMVSQDCWDPGAANPLYRPFCVFRLNADGTPDTTFSDQGNFYLVTGSGLASGIAIQNDSKLLVTGSGGAGLLITRLNSNGTLDPSFGSGGMAYTDVTPGDDDHAQKIAIQPDGKFVVVGYSQHTTGPSTPSTYQQFIARYLPNGTLDSSFGNGGIVKPVIGDGTGNDHIVVQADGKIVIGGYFQSGSAYYFTLARYNSDGSPDMTWDGDGVITGPPSTVIGALAIQLDGRILAIGGNILYRFNTDGSPDLSFDGDGQRPAMSTGYPNGLMVSAGGRITVVGGTGAPRNYNIAKYRADGSPDTSFSSDGLLNFDVANSDSQATSVAMDSQGRTVLAGLTGGGIVGPPFQQAKFSAARLVPSAPAGPVGLSGRVTRADGQPVAGAILILQGETRTMTAMTSPFGYYSFQNVPSGQAYAISPGSKKVMFDDRHVFVDGEVTSFNIISEPMADAGTRSAPSAVKIGPLPGAGIRSIGKKYEK